MIFNKTALYV